MGKQKQDTPRVVGKSLKMPVEWDRELTKLRGVEMSETGQEVSATAMILRALDQVYGLAKKTGVNITDED
jgi:hypothetical protein